MKCTASSFLYAMFQTTMVNNDYVQNQSVAQMHYVWVHAVVCSDMLCTTLCEILPTLFYPREPKNAVDLPTTCCCRYLQGNPSEILCRKSSYGRYIRIF